MSSTPSCSYNDIEIISWRVTLIFGFHGRILMEIIFGKLSFSVSFRNFLVKFYRILAGFFLLSTMASFFSNTALRGLSSALATAGEILEKYFSDIYFFLEILVVYHGRRFLS